MMMMNASTRKVISLVSMKSHILNPIVSKQNTKYHTTRGAEYNLAPEKPPSGPSIRAAKYELPEIAFNTHITISINANNLTILLNCRAMMKSSKSAGNSLSGVPSSRANSRSIASRDAGSSKFGAANANNPRGVANIVVRAPNPPPSTFAPARPGDTGIPAAGGESYIVALCTTSRGAPTGAPVATANPPLGVGVPIATSSTLSSPRVVADVLVGGGRNRNGFNDPSLSRLDGG
mmetsp:Transcript_237/g.700  ORF Transcript_237/g.700 Transcript_237/m.700 type:complete len:234 (+) Transcript_237:1100-1801(+)